MRASMLMGIPSPDLASLAIKAGYGSVILDCEHGFPMDGTMRAMVLGVHDAGGRCLVRIPLHTIDQVGLLADIGVDGIVLSGPRQLTDMEGVVARATFGASGSRSVNPFVPAAGQPGDLERLHTSAQSIELWAMAENSSFLRALDALQDRNAKDSPSWSGIIIGPYDLASDLGCEPDPTDLVLRGAVSRYVRDAESVGIRWGMFVRDRESLDRWRDLGFAPGLVVMGYDRDVWFQECRRRALVIEDTA